MKRILAYRLSGDTGTDIHIRSFDSLRDLDSAVEQLQRDADRSGSKLRYIQFWGR